MNGTLTVDGRSSPLSPKECKVVLKALGEYRKGLRSRRPSALREFDLEVWDFKRLGFEDIEIARQLGVTVKTVRGAIGRVENGRYGLAGCGD